MLKRGMAFFMLIVIIFLNVTKAYAVEDDLSEDEIEVAKIINGAPKILCKSAILYDRTYNKILFEKAPDARVANASTTKILTAIVAYENAEMDEVVTTSASVSSVGGSGMGLRAGNKIRMDDLMKGLLICSGNDAAVAIAEYIAGSTEAFCAMMNEKARELGAINTNFVTPHGLDRENHYTTAADLLIFADYFEDIPYLVNISNMEYLDIIIEKKKKNIHTTNEMLSIYDEANGIKTGYTGNAGRCLVTSITKDGRQLITIVLGCETKKQRTSETIQLISYGYNNFNEIDIYEDMKKRFEFSVEKAKGKIYEIVLSGEKRELVNIEDLGKVTYEYYINDDLKAPLKAGDELGKIEILIDGTTYKVIKLCAPVTIERKDVADYMGEILRSYKRSIEVKT